MSDFGDTYTCDVCTNTHLCLVCDEIDVVLHVDISYEMSNDKVDVVDVNGDHAAKILSSIKRPLALEVKPLPAFLEFNQNCIVIISSKLESEQEQSCYKY